MTEAQQDRLVNEKEFRAALGGISKPTLWRMQRDGLIMKPIKIGIKNFYKVAWIQELIDKFEKRS